MAQTIFAQMIVELDNTNTVLENLADVKVRALMKCGAIVENYAKQDAPVDTGRLRNSIHHEMENDDTVDIGTDVEYAIWQEIGTYGGDGKIGIKEKRFLTNGVRNHISEIKTIIEEEFRKG